MLAIGGSRPICRAADAAKIVEAIVAVLKGNPAYEKPLAIHIDYVSREPEADHSHVVSPKSERKLRFT
jgi:hypothetical protein